MGHLRAIPIAVVLLLAASASAAQAAPEPAPHPSCKEGPQTVGEVIVGTPCDDTIRAPRSVTTVYGEGGDDTLYGQRGNDTLYGGEGADRLYGGVGDDHLRGGNGDDLLSGGFGADSLDGEGGSDYTRGDATIDAIGDSGSSGDEDTLSFATGATPGFPNEGAVVEYEGFPAVGGERGVYVDLTQDFANDGMAPDGGGFDRPLDGVNFESFERVVGTPFSDLIAGSSGPEKIYGGGGADVILGEGGADQISGGADGDYCGATGGTTSSCEFSGGDEEVAPRNPAAIAVGAMAPGSGSPALYLAGSNAVDEVAATFANGPPRVTFRLLSGSAGAFDASSSAAGGCNPPASGEVVCPVTEAPDSIVLAGLGGDDSFTTDGFPATTSIVQLGGEGGDDLGGTEFEDVLVDGPGDDAVSAAGGDDAVPNNQGTDSLAAGAGDDLFISNSVCEGDVLDGGEGRDNANWANFGSAVALDMRDGIAGLLGGDGSPDCGGEPPTSLRAIEDIEGTNLGDTLIGDSGPNQLLGRLGGDSYFAAAGNDSILANSGDEDVTIDCGEGFDTAQVDHPQYGDPVPVDCEAIHERDPNSFRPPDTPPPSGEASASAPAEPQLPQSNDHLPPRTRILHRPQKTVLTRARLRKVAFVFNSNESGATFRCKLDHKRFTACSSPRAYLVAPGKHAVRIVAVDSAGNADPTPAVFRFSVRRR